jgi:excinuclease UvrABC nuclease subunit
MPEYLENFLTNLPSDSGVYFMKDKWRGDPGRQIGYR